MKRFFLFLFSTFYISCFTFAQDVHFSQFYFSPLTTNPAQTGFFNGKYRFAANYRQQWNFVPLPYKTFSASFDMQFLENAIGENDVLGAGIYFMNDKAGNGGIGTSGALASLAFHKDFSGGTNIVALGLQGGLMQIGFDPSILRFGDQIETQVNGVDGVTNEVFSKTSVQYADISAGLLWNFIPSEKINFYTGVSLLHLTSPSISFLDDNKSQLSSRFVLQGGAAVAVNSNIDILPAFLYMKQGGSKELYLGSALRFNFAEAKGVRFGGWYRLAGNSDAFVAFGGIDYMNLKLGLSYDVNISSLNEVSNSKGGFEIAIIYVITPPKKKGKGGINCPRF